MSKYTSTPWLRDGTTVYALEPSYNQRGVEINRNRFSFQICLGPDTPVAEGVANATLAASAPKMLEALKAAHDTMVMNGLTGRRAFEKVCAAITEAEGQ